MLEYPDEQKDICDAEEKWGSQWHTFGECIGNYGQHNEIDSDGQRFGELFGPV